MSQWLAPWLFIHRQYELDSVGYIGKHNTATNDIRLPIHGLIAVMTAGRRTGKDQVNLSSYPSNNNGGLHKDLP